MQRYREEEAQKEGGPTPPKHGMHGKMGSMTLAFRFGLLALLGLQVAFLLLHDWVPLGRLSNLSAVSASDSRSRLLWTTVLSALPFALVFGVSCAYCGVPHWPAWLKAWLLWTFGLSLASVVLAWWGPYLLWHSPKRAERYRVRFAGTMRFLPERHGFAPDTLHVLYHLCIVATLLMVWML